ncbi:MAG TPA: hypothetical protein VFA50_13480 [Stellaceae bacterium]|nr:hypothetical protein [Stellaceae bacterium]
MQIADQRRERVLAPAERRGHPRLDTRWWGDLVIGARHLECYVYNVSVGGAKLLVFGRVEPMRQALLFVPPFGVFRCDVRWAAYPFAGIEFAQSERRRSAGLVTHALGQIENRFAAG